MSNSQNNSVNGDEEEDNNNDITVKRIRYKKDRTYEIPVKKARDAYHIFCDETRAQVKTDLQAELGAAFNVTPQMVVKKLGIMWAEGIPYLQSAFKHKEKEDSKRYYDEVKAYFYKIYESESKTKKNVKNLNNDDESEDSSDEDDVATKTLKKKKLIRDVYVAKAETWEAQLRIKKAQKAVFKLKREEINEDSNDRIFEGSVISGIKSKMVAESYGQTSQEEDD